MFDDNEFFREATLRICGNLTLEQALHSTLLYVREHVPVDLFYMQHYDASLGATRTIARADETGGTRLDLVKQLPEREEVRRTVEELAVVGRALVMNRPDENWMATQMLQFYGIDPHAASVLHMQLVRDQELIASIAPVRLQRDGFTEEHARRMTLLAEPFRVALVNALRYRDLVRLQRMLEDDNRFLQGELQRLAGDEIVGADHGLGPVMSLVRQVAATDSPVLITGETGVGKDLIANALHQYSPRRKGPFIAVNCGAIPASLIDSELFGHEKGAFTGAMAMKRGRFERANNGTIFLDEIGEMPLDAQVRLLRVIQNREVERVGGTTSQKLDIRIVTATNKDLLARVKDGRFREDLYFRLAVFPISVPPLRARRGDIPALVQHFLERKSADLKLGVVPRLADGAIEILTAYDWPGNVRELANVVERAMILHRDEPLRFDELGIAPQSSTAPPTSNFGDDTLLLDQVIKLHIERVLTMADGKIHGPGGAGELLGVNPNTLRSRMSKLGIQKKPT